MKYEFKTINFAESIDSILSGMNQNNRTCKLIQSEIDNIKSRCRVVEIGKKDNCSEDSSLYDNTQFNSIMENYLLAYMNLDEDFTESDLISILPSVDDVYYKQILLRLHAESLKTINMCYEILENESNSTNDIKGFNNLIKSEERKIAYLKELISKSHSITDKTVSPKNKLIIIPSPSENYRILDDLKEIDFSYYERFNEILRSIENGTFKGRKSFTNNSELNGLCEVRGYQVRIPYISFGNNYYGIFIAFIKKSDNDRGYRENLIRRYSDAKRVVPKIKLLLNNQEFLEQNDLYVSEMFNILECVSNKSKKNNLG